MKRLAIALIACMLAAAAQAGPPTAADELGAAIKTLKAKHINRARADWHALEARAWSALPRNGEPEDAYPAIRTLMKELGEKHTFLIPRDSWRAVMTGRRRGSNRPLIMPPPVFRLLSGRVGYVQIPEFLGNDSAEKDYGARVRAGMAALRRQGACRYVVDLRGNTGGNMWPMLNGIAPLLGNPPFGFFEPGSDPGQVWKSVHGEVTAVDADIARIPAYVAKQKDPPVAVLVDHDTASSGEFTAMAFEGRAGVRVFGQPTAGFVTANGIYALPDGAQMAVTVSSAQDRLHREYRARIVPDAITAPGTATDTAALAWLGTCLCTAS